MSEFKTAPQDSHSEQKLQDEAKKAISQDLAEVQIILGPEKVKSAAKNIKAVLHDTDIALNDLSSSVGKASFAGESDLVLIQHKSYDDSHFDFDRRTGIHSLISNDSDQLQRVDKEVQEDQTGKETGCWQKQITLRLFAINSIQNWKRSLNG